MSEIDRRIRDALGGWGARPVLTELDSTGGTRSVGAAELRQRCDGIAALLRRGGIRRDDVVALFLENSIDYVAVILALFQIGAVPVFAKLEYRRTELTVLFRDIDPDAVIAEGTFLTTVAPFLAGRGVVAHEGDSLSITAAVARHHAQPGLSTTTASINCTYRGTGTLVGSMATERQYLHGAQVLQEGLQALPGESLLYPIPLSHIFTLVGCLFAPLLSNVTAVIARTVHPRVIFGAIGALGINHITAVPEIYRLLLRSRRKEHRFPELRTFVSGGSLLGDAEFTALTAAFSVEVLHGYGLTEFTPVSRNSRGESRGGTVGPICAGLDVQIVNPDDDGHGEIVLRSDALSTGYYNRPEETRDAFRDGWFHTGDEGHLESSHLVFDREIKKTRKVNGVMVDLEEVRRTIVELSSASNGEVFLEGNSIAALLELPESVDIDTEQSRLRSLLEGQIAAYKIPRRVGRIT